LPSLSMITLKFFVKADLHGSKVRY
jgi:hypothetical protein